MKSIALEAIPIGSTWYGWGHHFEVIERATRDGDPAVRCRYLKSPRNTFTVRLVTLLRHAERTEQEVDE